MAYTKPRQWKKEEGERLRILLLSSIRLYVSASLKRTANQDGAVALVLLPSG